MCGRYCSNRAAAPFWNECTWQAPLCVRACTRARLRRWVMPGTKRALTLTGCCRSDEKTVVVRGSQSDSAPLRASAEEEEVLRRRNVRLVHLSSSSSSKGTITGPRSPRRWAIIRSRRTSIDRRVAREKKGHLSSNPATFFSCLSIGIRYFWGWCERTVPQQFHVSAGSPALLASAATLRRKATTQPRLHAIFQNGVHKKKRYEVHHQIYFGCFLLFLSLPSDFSATAYTCDEAPIELVGNYAKLTKRLWNVKNICI